eukprot:TRINITY_DN30515_c0_g1_i1.p1 TRINITY_DN30515_c0_g1~~TRINITY_DN30515_c0_g1_i1.p1  ORF type:complete len:132 (-),score=26.13 TRINITY_DN30515_c0_g1_i1:57-452(-)
MLTNDLIEQISQAKERLRSLGVSEEEIKTNKIIGTNFEDLKDLRSHLIQRTIQYNDLKMHVEEMKERKKNNENQIDQWTKQLEKDQAELKVLEEQMIRGWNVIKMITVGAFLFSAIFPVILVLNNTENRGT